MEDVEGGATLKIEDPLLALMGRIDRAWDTNLSLVEGTPGVTRPELNRFIASNDDLYAQWLAVYLAFEGPTVAPRDLIALDDLRRLFAAYRAAAPSDDPAYALLATTESRLAEGALRQLDVDLQDEVLPSLHDLLGGTPAHVRLATAAASRIRAHHERVGGRFHILLRLHETVLPRYETWQMRQTEEQETDQPSPWRRWRGDLGRLLLGPEEPRDRDTLDLAISAHATLPYVLRLPAADLARVLLLDARLPDVGPVGPLARDHVDRCLAFLSLLELETPYGRQRLYVELPSFDGCRLYLLVSAIYRRRGPGVFRGDERTWLSGVADDEIEGELRRIYGDLPHARQALWESLAHELGAAVQGVSAEAGR